MERSESQPESDAQPRSPVLTSQFRKGRPPPNKGKKLTPQTLTPDELDRVMRSFGRTKVGVRNRAMVALMARMGFKVGQVIRMAHDAYHPGSNVVTVPGIQGGSERVAAVDVVTRQILDEWVEFRDELGVGSLAPFFCTVSEGRIGEEIATAYVRGMVRKHVKQCGIRKRVSPEGLRKTFQEQAADKSRRVGLDLVAYVEDEPFRKRYPIAHAQWRLAVDLYSQDAASYASPIGIACRESLRHFATELCDAHGVIPVATKNADKIREVIDTKADIPPEVSRVLDALLTLWRAVHDLVNRQVHANEVVPASLTADDSLRVLFQTMLLMYEIDRAMGAPA